MAVRVPGGDGGAAAVRYAEDDVDSGTFAPGRRGSSARRRVRLPVDVARTINEPPLKDERP